MWNKSGSLGLSEQTGTRKRDEILSGTTQPTAFGSDCGRSIVGYAGFVYASGVQRIPRATQSAHRGVKQDTRRLQSYADGGILYVGTATHRQLREFLSVVAQRF